MQTLFYTPTGVGQIVLHDGSTLTPANGSVLADAAYTNELENLGCVAVSQSASKIPLTDTRLPNRRPGYLLSDFQYGQWGDPFNGNSPASTAADPAHAMLGLTPLQHTNTAGGQYIQKTGMTGFQIFPGTEISLLVYVPANWDSVSNNPTIQLLFSTTDAWGASDPRARFQWGKESISVGWNVLTCKAGDDGSYSNGLLWSLANGFDFATATCTSLRLYTNVAAPGSGYIGAAYLAVLVGKAEPATLSWSFDALQDASFVAAIAPALDSFGWQASGFIDANNVPANAANLRSLVTRYGWDIGTQGVGHVNYTQAANKANLPADLVTARANHAAAGLPYLDQFAYPVNQSDPETDTILESAGFRWRRGAGPDLVHTAGLTPGTIGSRMIRHGTTGLGSGLAALKKRVDAAVAFGGILNLFSHGITLNPSVVTAASSSQASDFYGLLDYIRAYERAGRLTVAKPGAIATQANP